MELKEIICNTIESVDIREYLKQLYRENGLDSVLMKNIICGAPITLDEKLRYITCVEKLNPENVEVSSAKRRLEEALYSLRHATDDERFTVEDMWFDLDIYEEKGHLLGIYDDIESAISGIRNNMEYEQEVSGENISDDSDDWAGTNWYEIKKWTRIGNGYVNTYTYYHDENSIKWFENNADILGKEIRMPHGDAFLNSSGIRLYPEYNPGNLLSIDCRPFRPHTVVEVLEKDIGGLWIQFKSEDNKTNECYLHNLGLILYPLNPISPFYRIKKIDKEVASEIQ